MHAATPLVLQSLEEFEAMPKEEHLNYEFIDGVVLMSPSPSRAHQTLGAHILATVGNQLKHTPCDPLYELDIKHHGCIYKPDLLIFGDREAELPEIIFEILSPSPSSRYRDLRVKLVKYEEMGIKEYWIIDPKLQSITIYDFVNGTAEAYAAGDTAQSLAHPEIKLAVADIFA